MELINLSFRGWFNVDKEDLVIMKMTEDDFERVDLTDVSFETIKENVQSGKWFINFEKSYSKQLDGENDIDIEDCETI